MEDSRTDPVPGTSHPTPSTEQHSTPQPTSPEEPSERAYPLLVLTPVPEPRAPREPWSGAVHIVAAGIAILVISAELGRRAGVPARLSAVCSAAGFAVVIVPWLVSATPLSGPRSRSRQRPAAAVAAH